MKIWGFWKGPDAAPASSEDKDKLNTPKGRHVLFKPTAGGSSRHSME